MEKQFEAVLTGTDTPVDGIVTQKDKNVYEFNSLDGSLQLTIARNNHSTWERVTGSEPYLSGWTDELGEQIQNAI